jgi:hypothetical protein
MCHLSWPPRPVPRSRSCDRRLRNWAWHTGDTLLAVNDQKYTGTAILSEAYAKARPGDLFELRVKSVPGEHSVVLPVTPGTAPLSQVIFDVLLNIVAPIGCALLGSWVVLIRPRDGWRGFCSD